jgi:hypothetical protein
LVEIPQPTPITQANYHLTTNDRIAVLEAELFNLRTRRPVHPQFNCTTRAQKARNTNVDIDDEEAVMVARAQQSRIEEIPDEDATPPPQEASEGNPSTSTSTRSQLTDGPEHPYRLAKDAAYSPPVTKNVGAQEKPVAIYIAAKKKYKPVHLKVKPVIGELPDKFRIIRNIIGDPLKDLPTLPTDPPRFKPTGRYTKERKNAFDTINDGFLWPSERHLLHYFMMIHNDAFAWETSERGHFREDFFPPVDIPVVPHKPWIQRNIPIPPGLYDELCKLVKQKMDAGVFKPSNSSY